MKVDEIILNRESSEPLYVQLQNAVKEKIASGEWPANHRLPSYKDIAQITGVSIITIQQSIGGLIKQGVLQRKRGVGIFVPGPEMRAQSKVIGLLLTDVRHPFFSEIAHTVQGVASQFGYTVMMSSLGSDRGQAVHGIDLLLNRQIDGVITTPAIVEDYGPQFEELKRQRLPIVFVDGHPSGDSFGFVQSCNRKGIELVLDHLVSLGHRNIGFACCQVVTQSVQERIQAFQEILSERGLPYTPTMLQVSHLANDDGGWDAGMKLLALRTPPTAIVCSNDLAAIGVLRAAREQGVACPEALSVVGFDDLDMSSHLETPLTTVRQPVQEIGEKAFSLLLRQIEGQPDGDSDKVLLDPELIVRASTGSAPSA